MQSHYDVLGVSATATAAEIRTAYVGRARSLHPDVHAGGPQAEVDGARRAMQDVNEAWRVLRDPERRAEYDRSLVAVAAVASEEHLDWFDRPYEHRVAEPGDVTIALVRAAPWAAVLVVLAIIFVFTAFARNDDAADADLVGRCVATDSGSVTPVSCDAPNDGRVVRIGQEANHCSNGAEAREVSGGTWLCLRPADAD